MASSPLRAELTVAEVLTRWPQTVQVFLRHQMACVGCVMAPYDTLADVSAIYDVPLDRLLEELWEVIQRGGARE